MKRPATVDVQFRLAAPSLPEGAHVRVRSFGERWTAVVRMGGAQEPRWGLGRSARQALDASLVGLPRATRAALLADLALLGPSTEIARFRAGHPGR